MRAKLMQQCRDASGIRGSFLLAGGKEVSPTFKDTADLFRWCRNNGWAEVPGTFAGEYEKEIK